MYMHITLKLSQTQISFHTPPANDPYHSSLHRGRSPAKMQQPCTEAAVKACNRKEIRAHSGTHPLQVRVLFAPWPWCSPLQLQA